LLLLALAVAPLRAGKQELKTVAAAAEAVHAFSEMPLSGIPRALLHDAAGVALIPHLVKVGLLLDGRFGRGVICVHEPTGRWSDPLFVTLEGVGIGGQAGLESTQLVLVFKTQKSLDRALKGKLTLGGDVTVAAGPVGRDAEAASDRLLRAEIYAYSRSKGLFLGVSLEGTALRQDLHANEAFYGIRKGRPEDVRARRGAAIAATEPLKAELAKVSGPPAPSPHVVLPAGRRR
jgi:lipid-binding SYLF domain-containing protein